MKPFHFHLNLLKQGSYQVDRPVERAPPASVQQPVYEQQYEHVPPPPPVRQPSVPRQGSAPPEPPSEKVKRGTQRDTEGHRGTDRDRQGQTGTDRDRQGQRGQSPREVWGSAACAPPSTHEPLLDSCLNLPARMYSVTFNHDYHIRADVDLALASITRPQNTP